MITAPVNSLRQQGQVPASSAPKRPSPTLTRLDELRREQSAAHEAAMQLEAVLESALSTTQTGAGSEKPKDDLWPSNSPLCDELDARIQHATRTRLLIESLIARLTL